MLERVLEWIKELKLSHPRLGMYDTAELPISIYDAIRETGAEIVDITKEFTVARQPKSDFEIELIKQASELAIASFEHVVKIAEVGMSDRQLVGAGGDI